MCKSESKCFITGACDAVDGCRCWCVTPDICGRCKLVPGGGYKAYQIVGEMSVYICFKNTHKCLPRKSRDYKQNNLHFLLIWELSTLPVSHIVLRIIRWGQKLIVVSKSEE